jgi:hypothetical protein
MTMPGKHVRKLLFLLTVPGAVATAAPPMVMIQDTVYKADGSRFSGFLQIEWKSFRASDGTEVAQGNISARVQNGQLMVTLIPTTTATPAAAYTVRYNADGHTQFTEFWAVPPSAYPLRLTQVRTTSIPQAGNITSPAAPVDIQTVTGLRTELDLRPARGPSWVAGRTAVIGSSGMLEGAIGAAGDCVRVDGTSGPCGVGGLLYIDGETPLGVMDAVNRTFELSTAPSPPTGLALYRNGALLLQGQAYTLAGRTITMAAPETPRSGDILTAWYRVDSYATVTVDVADFETPAGAVNGVNRDFVLSATPLPAASLQLFRNGLLQKAGVDYTLSVNRINFLSVSTPQPGDILQATYRK